MRPSRSLRGCGHPRATGSPQDPADRTVYPAVPAGPPQPGTSPTRVQEAQMFEKFQEIKARREEGEKGFTLIELLVVVVIIGILVAIAIPLYLHFENGAKTSSAESDVHNAVAVVQQCAADNQGTLPADTTGVGPGSVTFCTGQDATVSTGNTLTY